jgi:predicted RNA binding protein YcfA (HicA-like mRNA interferase family)
MTKLPLISSDDVIKKLRAAGFDYAPYRGKGSHVALYKIGDDGSKLFVIVPPRDPIPRETLLSILKQARLTKEEFLELRVVCQRRAILTSARLYIPSYIISEKASERGPHHHLFSRPAPK